MSTQRLLWPDAEPEELAAGWQPIAEIPRQAKVASPEILDVLAKRHDEGGWNGMPGRWIFLREVLAHTGSWGEQQRFDALAVGLVPSVNYARIVYEVKISRGDWLRELRPKTIIRYGAHRVSGAATAEVLKQQDLERALGPGHTVETVAKWAAAMAVATEFWYAAPVRTILPAELPEGAGLLEVRPWGKSGELRARVAVSARRLETSEPGPEFWAAVLRKLAGRQRMVPV